MRLDESAYGIVHTHELEFIKKHILLIITTLLEGIIISKLMASHHSLRYNDAGPERIGLPPRVLETLVLPLNYGPYWYNNQCLNYIN